MGKFDPLIQQKAGIHGVNFVETPHPGAQQEVVRYGLGGGGPDRPPRPAELSSFSSEPDEKSPSRSATRSRPKIAKEMPIKTPAAARMPSSPRPDDVVR